MGDIEAARKDSHETGAKVETVNPGQAEVMHQSSAAEQGLTERPRLQSQEHEHGMKDLKE